jgi:hypothetical protein
LDAALATLDELSAKDRNFPSEMAAIESRHDALTNQELDSIEAIQSRSAEMSKIVAMRELAVTRQKKLKTAIAAQTEAVIKTGMQAARLLEARWSSNYGKRADEVRAEFDRLFYRFGLEQNLQDAYKPLTLLQWLRVPNLYNSRFSPPDTIITKCRQLRESTTKLKEFEGMTFAQISERLDEIDRQARELRERPLAGEIPSQQSAATDLRAFG